MGWSGMGEEESRRGGVGGAAECKIKKETQKISVGRGKMGIHLKMLH